MNHVDRDLRLAIAALEGYASVGGRKGMETLVAEAGQAAKAAIAHLAEASELLCHAQISPFSSMPAKLWNQRWRDFMSEVEPPA